MENRAPSPTHILRLILVPSLIALAVTLFRLTGELLGWSPVWFQREAGGVIPAAVNWLIGITWLAIPFGAYFGAKLTLSGLMPERPLRGIAFAAAGLVLLYGGLVLLVPRLASSDEVALILIWSLSIIAAALQWFGWAELVKVLLAYGFASRLPVAVIMFFAMKGAWGTHYDYGGRLPENMIGSFSAYLWFGFFPQLVFWVGFTIVVGSLTGCAAAALVGNRRVRMRAASA